MTIIATMAIQNAFIFGSESRQVLGDAKWFKSILKGDYSNKKIEVMEDEFPKTFLIGEQYGLNYSGPGFMYDWSINSDIYELQRMVADGHYSFHDLAIYFNDKLKRALDKYDQKYTFHMAGFPKGYPIMAASDDGKLIFYEGTEKTTGLNITKFAGFVDILEKIMKDEMLDYGRMTIKEAVEFIWLTITAGYKYLEYFTKYPEVSGGPINILIVTPDKCKFLKFPPLSISLKEGGMRV